MSYKAVHLEGGNFFDNVLINIDASFKIQDKWLQEQRKKQKSVKRSIFLNYTDLAIFALLKKLNLWETMFMTGLKRAWFDEFHDYWVNVMGGRPITIMDFHHLRFNYRTKSQHVHQLKWDDASKHLENWQAPNNIHAIFHFVVKYALHPFRSRNLLKILKKDMRILEYGCSLAPMYRTYRQYLNHIPTRWVLADIPNFPFHYARHVYAKDVEIEQFITITEPLFDDPLKDVSGNFDLIIVQEVFEHLHKPRYIAEYLVKRLNSQGLLLFDYMKTSGEGHDTPVGVKERAATLTYLSENLEMIYGSFRNDDRSLDVCVGRKR